MDKDTLSPIATNKEQYSKLSAVGIPVSTADMYIVKHFALPGEYRVMDKHYYDCPPDGVDHIPAWSLSRLIDLLPDAVNVAEDEDGLDCIQYDLHIDKNYVKYVADDSTEPIYETFGLHTIDAAVDMIVLLINYGWSEEMFRQYNEKK